MRVLVVDQDSASNLAITRSLRDLFTVDCVTNKGDCLDLLRSNQFEVIVATERLEDGSGLELLGQISKKWPSVLRIFAADRQRLQLLRGRLGPFELFQTLPYPIEPQKLLATLEMAAVAQQGDVQPIELTAEAPAEVPEPAAEPDDPLGPEQSDEFSEPRFARAGSARPMQVTSVGGGSSARSAPAHSPAPASRSRQGPAVSALPVAPTARRSRARTTEPNLGNDLASKFPGSGTLGSRRNAAGSPIAASGGPSRSARVRPAAAGKAPARVRPAAAGKAPPVKFPPLERTPPLERIAALEPAVARSPGADFSEAAAMARAARSNYDSTAEEFDTRRLTTMIGGGLAVAAVVVFLGFKMFGSRTEAPKPVAPAFVAHAPEYPPEVTDLVAQTEAAFKADDFKAARADVDELRRLSPSHPRLAFFQGLLTAKGSGVVNGRGSKKKSGSSAEASKTANAAPASPGSHPAGSAGVVGAGGNAGPETAAPGFGNTAGVGTSAQTVKASGAGSPAADATPSLPPETPVGLSRATLEPAAGTNTPVSAAATVPASPTASAPTPGAAAASSAAVAASAPAPSTAEPAHAAAPASPSTRRSSGEPPPVVQEAKLVRRITPDYPSPAKKDGISGFVDLDVTVSKQGLVEDVSVVQSTPPDMFDKSAVAAVRKWKYEPRFIDGLPSQAHLKVHLDFGPNK